MSHFALVINDVVEQVIVAEQDFIDALPNATSWIQTSYNTRGGQHRLGGTPLRKNYAGIGYTYDAIRDAFIPPQPYISWSLNENECLWHPPIAYPEDGKSYKWDETMRNWVEITE
jgi:hypothetical protein